MKFALDTFNSSKVQLEREVGDTFGLSFVTFNSSKVQLELADLTEQTAVCNLSIPVRYN